MTWLDELKTRPQAIDDLSVPREAIASWPSPCGVCGAHYKLTPKGRFHIEHRGDIHQGAPKRFIGDAA